MGSVQISCSGTPRLSSDHFGSGGFFFNLLVDSTDPHLDTISGVKPTILMENTIEQNANVKRNKRLSGNMELQHQIDKPELEQKP